MGPIALAAIGLMFILPAMAEAQLFPNRPIKRQREACVNEPPFYKQVKQEYYGYFPTCWSKFPAGWACPCPNPELPNAAAEFAKRPRETTPRPLDGDPDLGPGMDGDRPMPGDPPTGDPSLPPLPSGRAPFDLDSKPGTPAQPPGAADPFEPRDPGTNPPARPATPPAGRNPASSGIRPMPAMPDVSPASITEANREPGSMAMAPEATLASNEPTSRPNLGPLPSTPVVNPGVMTDEAPLIGVPAPAPQRKSILSGLFGSGNRRRR